MNSNGSFPFRIDLVTPARGWPRFLTSAIWPRRARSIPTGHKTTAGQFVLRSATWPRAWLLAALAAAVAAFGIPSPATCQAPDPNASHAGGSRQGNLAEVEPSFGEPTWFKNERGLSAQTNMLFIESPAMSTIAHAEDELDRKMLQEVNGVIKQWYPMLNPVILDLDAGYITNKLVFENRREIRQDLEFAIEAKKLGADSSTKGYRGYVQLHLPPAFRDHIRQRYSEKLVEKRLKTSGLVAGGLFSALLIVFTYLKLELATRSYYSRRLQAMSAFLVLVVVLVCVWLSQLL